MSSSSEWISVPSVENFYSFNFIVVFLFSTTLLVLLDDLKNWVNCVGSNLSDLMEVSISIFGLFLVLVSFIRSVLSTNGNISILDGFFATL
jgi:hypothetical protein